MIAQVIVGDHVRPVDRSGLWRVVETSEDGTRARCKPTSDVWVHKPRWFAVEDLVRSREE